MDLHPLLSGRYSCRHYLPREIDDAALQSVLEAARWAPSSYNDQPWTFFVARRRDAQAFQALLACTGGNADWCKDAGALLACVAARAYTHNGRPHRHAWHDIGLAVMAMAVQGVHLGLQMREMGGIEADKVRALYGVPDTHDVVTGLAIGLPAPGADPGPRRTRKPLQDIIMEGSWGRRAAWLK